MREDKRIFAEIMVKENGKCLSEAMGEIDYGLGFIEWYAEEAKRVYGDTIPSHANNATVLVVKEPVGPTASITRWNFPFMMIARKIATALAAGCTMIIKPSEETPLTAYKLLEYARKAGIPEGVFEMVTGDPREIGPLFTGDDRIRKISFTGSTAVGKLLAEASGKNLKKMTLELGGNAPFVVFDDANFEDAVAGIIAAKLRNSGQVCISPNRIYVHNGIYDAFVAAVTERVARIRVDQGLQDEFVVGPLVNKVGFDKVSDLVEGARAAGAHVALGGKAHAKGGLFYEPTILAEVTDQMKVAQTEIFGPVFPFYRFESEDEVIQRANNTEYGLVAYAYTRDIARAFRLSRNIEAGIGHPQFRIRWHRIRSFRWRETLRLWTRGKLLRHRGICRGQVRPDGRARSLENQRRNGGSSAFSSSRPALSTYRQIPGTFKNEYESGSTAMADACHGNDHGRDNRECLLLSADPVADS